MSIMQQKINLYTLLPRIKKSFLNLKVMAVSYGIFLLVLVLNFCFESWTQHKQVVVGRQLQMQLNNVQSRLAEIKVHYPMLDPNDMENSVKKLQQEFNEKNSVFGMLVQNKNFSTYLVGIAKAAADGVWLVDIQAAMNEQNIALHGYASSASAIQDFLSNLQQQKEFSGIFFQLQEVVNTDLNKEKLLSFTISTKVNDSK